jgi:bifunctional UDP-N-acetylglucosamine pyrophosphorylase/glucosamine-1-phosphate N-acetyltransferase
MTDLLAIVLAAGEGTRMRSATPKVLHEVGGLAIVGHVLRTSLAAGASVATVVGPNHEGVEALVGKLAPGGHMATQVDRLGTGHAVRQAAEAYRSAKGNVLVLFADNPLISQATIAEVTSRLDAGADMVVVGFRPASPAGYGRLLVENGRLVAIREEKDATEDERAIGLCNSGIMGFRADTLRAVIDRIGNANKKGEYYITDAVELANADGKRVDAIEADANEVIGVDDRTKLAQAEATFQEFRRAEFMKAGVTLRDPATVYFSWDTEIAPDVVIEPNVWIGPGVKIGEGAKIFAFSHIENAILGPGVTVGPFARMRGGAVLEDNVHIGNFVELKKAHLGKGVKAGHLSYLGDAEVGAGTNIGAGTITSNYDGVNKTVTTIGANVFVGSHTSLIAPVTIGDGAYTASGSVITKDVEPGAMAVARSRQENKPGYAAKLRAKAEAIKASKKRG